MAWRFMHGWISLPTGGELYLEHGVPRRVSVVGEPDAERLVDEIAEVTDLHVVLGRWERDDEQGDMQAEVHVDVQDIAEVLERLAHASAETFYDRYRKPIDADDVDFDDEAYACDFNLALTACGLRWGQADQRALRAGYRQALHAAAEEIARHPEA